MIDGLVEQVAALNTRVTTSYCTQIFIYIFLVIDGLVEQVAALNTRVTTLESGIVFHYLLKSTISTNTDCIL